jgi:hypothetical protein
MLRNGGNHLTNRRYLINYLNDRMAGLNGNGNRGNECLCLWHTVYEFFEYEIIYLRGSEHLC